jgi:hypothetical protein
MSSQQPTKADHVNRMNSVPAADEQPPARTLVYEVRPATTGEGFDLISDALAAGRLRLSKQHVAIGYATLHSGSRASSIRVYDAHGELVATHEQPAGRTG